MALIVGIDLGTTNSAVAIADENGTPRILETAAGAPTMPSTVSATASGVAVGVEAEELAASDPQNTFRGIKRLLGRKARAPEVVRIARAVPFRVAASPNGDCWLRVHDEPTPPQELAAATLKALRDQAEQALGEPVLRAVLAVPAYFDDAQRQAVRDAGRIAGLEVLRLINEPTAAALAYGMDGRDRSRPTNVAIFDLGGGTFDISILHIENDVFQVLATQGDDNLGGDDWDRRILETLLDKLFTEHQFDATSSPLALSRLRREAERAKIELSDEHETVIHIDALRIGDKVITFEHRLTRTELESMTLDLCDRLAEPCAMALKDAGMSMHDLDEVLLVGGMARVPMVLERVSRLLGETSGGDVDPRTAVASGAAICASVLAGGGAPATLLDVTSHPLSVRIGAHLLSHVVARAEELPLRRQLRVELEVPPSGTITIELLRGDCDQGDVNAVVGRALLELPAEALGGDDSPADGLRVIELNISIDVNSIVGIDAVDELTGARARSRIRTRGSLSQSQLVRIVEADSLAVAASRDEPAR